MTAEIPNPGGLDPEKQRIIRIRELRRLVRDGLLSEETFRRELSLYEQRPLLPATPTVTPVEETKPQMTLTVVEVTPPVAETQIISAEVAALYKKVTAMIPITDLRTRLTTGYIGPEQYKGEITAFCQYAQDLHAGKIAPVDPFKAVAVPRSKKTEVAKECLRQMLVPIVVEDRTKSIRAIQLELAKGTKELRDYLGSHAEDILKQSIENLSSVEQAILFSSASISLMTQLGYLDLEVCDEVRLATYLCKNAFGPVSDREDRFVQLLAATIDRGQTGTLDLSIIVDMILQHPNSSIVLERLIESAGYGCFDGHLTQLFSAHHQSKQLLSLMEEPEDGSEPAPLPRYRLLDPLQFNGRRKIPPFRGRYHD